MYFLYLLMNYPAASYGVSNPTPNTRNPNNLEQRQLDILTMQLLVNLFGSLIFDVAANRFFTPVAAHGAHEVAFGPKFATP